MPSRRTSRQKPGRKRSASRFMRGGAAAAADLVTYVENCAEKVVDKSKIDEVAKNLKEITADVIDAEKTNEKIDTNEIAADVKAEEVRAKKIIEKLPDAINLTDRAAILRKIQNILSGKVRDILPAIDTLVDAMNSAYKKQMDKIEMLVLDNNSSEDTKKSRLRLYSYRASVKREYIKNKKWIVDARKTIAAAIKDKDPDEYIKLTISSVNISEYFSSILSYIVHFLTSTFILTILISLLFGKNTVNIKEIMESVLILDILYAGIAAILIGTLSIYRNFFIKKKDMRSTNNVLFL